MNISRKINHQDKIGTALRYKNPKGGGWFGHNSSGKKLYIEPRALEYLMNLNGYDQHQVCKGIEALSSVSSPNDGMVSTQRPTFFKAKNATSTVFNFVIKYQLTSEFVVITGIQLNSAVLGRQATSSNERSALYSVKRIGGSKLTKNSSLSDIDGLRGNWIEGAPVTKVKTKHASVNGMLNNLEKAAWLMGAHADAAFNNDKFDEFTLFHNPTESAGLDFYESVKDNLGLTTQNAKQLAAVLADVQSAGQPVKWVVHSQGGIIFKQALAYHLKRSNQSLDKNSVVFHAGGNNKKETEKLLKKVGIQKVGADRDNPFDLVPNIAGRNDLSISGIKRSVQFWEKVKGTATSGPSESPHTLPFLSLDAYHGFLTLAGDNKSAERVKKHMNSLSRK